MCVYRASREGSSRNLGRTQAVRLSKLWETTMKKFALGATLALALTSATVAQASNIVETAQEAGSFKKNSNELKNIMRKRAIKLYIIFGCIGLALLLYILVPLFS